MHHGSPTPDKQFESNAIGIEREGLVKQEDLHLSVANAGAQHMPKNARHLWTKTEGTEGTLTHKRNLFVRTIKVELLLCLLVPCGRTAPWRCDRARMPGGRYNFVA